MASKKGTWIDRHPERLTRVVLALLIGIVAVESFLLYQQGVASHAIESQSAKLLNTFLQGDSAKTSGGHGVAIRLQNVRFKWSEKVYIDAGNMAVRALPVQGTTVNFDDPGAFVMSLQQSIVLIRPEVLEGMFNESIFNYPGSRVRDLKVTLVTEANDHMVQLGGKVGMGLWIPFTMFTHLSVDTKTNTLVIDVDHLKLFGHIPATKLISWTPLHLDRLISLPPNQSLRVDGNRMMVKPFGLFPPPRVTGRMADVKVDGEVIRLSFAGDPVPAPKSDAKNYVYLRGGTSQFGNFQMLDTDVLILDRTPADPFVFSLLHYADLIPRSAVEVHDTKAVQVTMPDF